MSGIHFILRSSFVAPFPVGSQWAVMATGCFWGSEKAFWRLPGVHSTAVVYAGGAKVSPTYEEVCSGTSGHAEGVLVVWDPLRISFSDLLTMFWTSHDPTQGDRQGNDRGSQYRSAIYVANDDYAAVAQASAAAYAAALGRPTTTEIKSVGHELAADRDYYLAEDYHQQYLAKPGARMYCSAQPTGVALPAAAEWMPSVSDANAAALPMLDAAFWKKHQHQKGVCNIGAPDTPIAPPAAKFDLGSL